MREGDRLQEIERERAKAMQVRTDGNRNLVPENLPEQAKGDSRDIAAKKLGMSGKIKYYFIRSTPQE